MGVPGLCRESAGAADVPGVRVTTMSYSAVAMYLGAILFRRLGENDGNGGHDDEFGREEGAMSARRPDRGLRRPGSGDPVLVEDDYYRFLNQPRG
jgi:hypothetical protein